MQTAKQEVNKLLKTFPSDCTLEDIQYHLYVLQKIGRGLKDVEEGRVYTQSKLRRKWRNGSNFKRLNLTQIV
ncbi:MAG: hypothetical protein KGZ58_00255 [Ignavibacteriales bacterium]|nr:hypothetical protein [Ignavibacteriales bacterium]